MTILSGVISHGTKAVFIMALGVFAASSLNAQEWVTEDNAPAPELPQLLQELETRGIQVFYMGVHDNVHGWMIVQGGVPNYFYQNAGGNSLIQGIMYDAAGENVTATQLRNLQFKEGDVLTQLIKPLELPKEALANNVGNPQQATPPNTVNPSAPLNTANQAQPQANQNLSPAQALFKSFENANWASFGSQAAPSIYVVIDPDCPHCRRMMQQMRPITDAGQIQMRVVPIGFNETSKKVSALMLATANPENLFYNYVDGKTNNAILEEDINTTGVDRNIDLVREWKLDATPFTVYKSKSGEIKLIRGIPQDPGSLISDVAQN